MKAAQAIACAAFAVGVLDFYFYIKGTFLLSRFLVTKRRVQGGVATSERRRRDTGGINTYAKRVCWRRRDRGELTHTRSMCVGVAETGEINTYAKCVLASPRQGQKVAGTG